MLSNVDTIRVLWFYTCHFSLLLLALTSSGQTKSTPVNKSMVETGVSKSLAQHRKQTISRLRYGLQ
ncbi:MAG: hypothetical protein LH609_13585, partial [Rudanella sp.]|nr:hypothetical protein [Rudanella sp.]